MVRLAVVIVVLVAGYYFLVAKEQEKHSEQREGRETRIMDEQQEFKGEAEQLNDQLQKDLDKRMKNQ